MTTNTWRATARAVIQQALEEAERQGLSPEATKAYTNSRYPFGAREHHPYKIWLSEMQRTFAPVASNTTAKAQSDRAKLQAWNEGRPL